MVRRIWLLLRNRKLAVVLIGLVALYGIAGTLVPQGQASSPAVAEWALAHPEIDALVSQFGMHQAFSTPVFLALALLLIASTAACALERTRRAERLRRSMLTAPSDAVLERLRDRPEHVIALKPTGSAESQLADVTQVLSASGLKSETGDGWVSGRAGLIGLTGSPLFHWSLVAFMLVTALGQATRSEGFLPLALGHPVPEAHQSYLQVVEGPLFREQHTGFQLEMTELDRSFTRNDTEYGAAPYVRVSRDLEPIAEGWVHPNSPLRAGPLMIHMAAFGPAVIVAVESGDGAELGRTTLYLDTTEDEGMRVEPQVVTLDANSAAALAVRVTVLTRPSNGETVTVSRAQLETAPAGGAAFGSPTVVPEGAAMDLPDSRRLRVVEVTDWARVSVANDWSVPFIYALLGLSIVGLAVAVLVPARRASVLIVETEEGPFLHVAVWHDKGDPAFGRRVVAALTAAVGGPEDR